MAENKNPADNAWSQEETVDEDESPSIDARFAF